jgi:Ala-tRNA(Pro) deacylase
MPIEKLRTFLDREGVKYVVISHSRAYTAQEAAASAHIPGRELAKTVIVKLDGKMAMAVLPASYHIDLDHLAEAAGAKQADLASEHEFAGSFPDCDTGAMPPFGNLYGMDVYAAESLAEDEEIAFAAGSHTELIRLAYQDFERLVKPKVLAFSERTMPA